MACMCDQQLQLKEQSSDVITEETFLSLIKLLNPHWTETLIQSLMKKREYSSLSFTPDNWENVRRRTVYYCRARL